MSRTYTAADEACEHLTQVVNALRATEAFLGELTSLAPDRRERIATAVFTALIPRTGTAPEEEWHRRACLAVRAADVLLLELDRTGPRPAT